MNMQYSRITLVSALALMITACSGGGDGDSSADISGGTTSPTSAIALSEANMENVASVTLTSESTVYMMGGIAIGQLVGAETSTGGSALNLLASKAINRFLAGVKNLPSAETLVGAEFEEVLNCEDGGTMTYHYNLANMESDPKAGDSFSVTANNCKYRNMTDNGRLSFVINNYTGSWQGETFVGQIDFSVDADHLRSATADALVDMDGDMQLTIDTRASNYWYYTMKSNSLTYTNQVGSVSQTVTVNNVDSVVRDNFVNSSSETTKMNYNFVVASSALNGSGSVTLLETIVSYWDASAPSAGKVRVTGSNGTLVMTYQPDGSVALQLQQDGGGTDVTRIVSRSELDGLFELGID